MNLKKGSTKDNPFGFHPLVKVVPSGSLVPHERLVEITTRSVRSFATLDWRDPYPQIYLAQTPHLHVAVHRTGRFIELHKYKLGEGPLKKIHEAQEKGFRKLRVLLGIILDLARASGEEQRLSVLCQRGKLTLHKNIDGKSCLPDDHLSLFNPPTPEEIGKK